MNKNKKTTKKFIDEFVVLSCLFTAVAVIFGHTVSKHLKSPDADVSVTLEISEKIIAGMQWIIGLIL